MIILFKRIFFDQCGGLGITQASLVSAIADRTGDESADAVVKIKRLINEEGPQFCNITNWPFLRSDISFSIGTSAYTYSGASYLPATFKKVVGAFILDGTIRYPLKEVSIKEAYEWANPNDNDGTPDEFCVTRNESDYWEIQFNRTPDRTYTVYMDIELQWADLTASNETVITKQYYKAFSHFVSMARFTQQGDTENYQMAKDQWDSPSNFRFSILGTILANLSSPLRKKSVKVDEGYLDPFTRQTKPYGSDYNE